MKILLENSRYQLYHLAKKREKKKTIVMDAAMVNLYVSEAWVDSSVNAMEIFGGKWLYS